MCNISFTVRLTGGPSSREGRLEVSHGGDGYGMTYDYAWGTVCDDGFTDAAARVVCHSLGFGYVQVISCVPLRTYHHTTGNHSGD